MYIYIYINFTPFRECISDKRLLRVARLVRRPPHSEPCAPGPLAWQHGNGQKALLGSSTAAGTSTITSSVVPYSKYGYSSSIYLKFTST